MNELVRYNLSQEPEDYNRMHQFLRAALALGLICSIQAEEKQHSARWNRTRGAEEAILRVCDISLPDGMDKARLTSIMDVLDGPIDSVFKRHWTLLMDAVAPAAPPNVIDAEYEEVTV